MLYHLVYLKQKKTVIGMETSVKISSKHQIAIPAKVRKELHLAAGDKLLILVSGNKIIMEPVPKSYTEYMQGLGKEVWNGKGEELLRKERESWKR